MWISSVVISLASEAAVCETVPALSSITAFELGERQGLRLPVVVEAPDGSTSRYWYEWIEQLPGVVHVEVAFVSFDESQPTVEDAISLMGV